MKEAKGGRSLAGIRKLVMVSMLLKEGSVMVMVRMVLSVIECKYLEGAMDTRKKEKRERKREKRKKGSKKERKKEGRIERTTES